MSVDRSPAAPDKSAQVLGVGSTAQTAQDTVERAEDVLPNRSVVPSKIDKFVILRQVGAGGMGVVYSAFDEYLERQVALKLVRGSQGGAVQQTRMLREAQALARLSHPNVVQIYEVGEYDSEVYLAMEFLNGRTLAAWIEGEREESSANIRRILEVFIAAGRGLEAAHHVGVVHRDFKPRNVLVGEDGRVCVLDFGLAASASTGGGASLTATSDAATGRAFSTELTQAGTILGTPAYMAPEQLAGSETDIRADIFAFCVALHEAVFCVRPFVGTSVTDLLRNIHGGVREQLPVRKTPGSAWLIPILERGLAPDPADRWQSMGALLDALSNDPSQRRRKFWLGGSLLIVCTLIFAGVMAYPLLRERACEQEAAVTSEFWNHDVRGQLERAFLASGSPHGSATWKRVEGRLDAWEEQWRSQQVRACLVPDPPKVLAARTSCLQNQLWQFEGLLDTFTVVDAKLSNRAVNAVLALPASSNCYELYRQYSNTKDDGAREPVDAELSRTLAKMQAALSAGHHKKILTELEPLLSQLDDKSRLRAEVLYLLGNAFRRAGDHKKAVSLLEEAYYIAGGTGKDRLAADASVVLMAITGADLDHRVDAIRWGEHASMMIDRAGLKGQEVEARYLINRAVLDRRAGNYEEAAKDLLNARRVTEVALGSKHPSIARILSNYANVLAVMEKGQQAQAQLREALALFIENYGPEHPDVAVFYTNLGVTLINEDNVEEGVRALQKALEADRVNLGPEHPAVGVGLFNIGTTLDEAGDLEGAGELYEQALAILKGALGPKHRQVALVSTAFGWLLSRQGDFPRAQELLEQALEVRVELSVDPVHLAETQLHLAQTLWLQDNGDVVALGLATKAVPVLKDSGEYGTGIFSKFESWSKTHLSEETRDALLR